MSTALRARFGPSNNYKLQAAGLSSKRRQWAENVWLLYKEQESRKTAHSQPNRPCLRQPRFAPNRLKGRLRRFATCFDGLLAPERCTDLPTPYLRWRRLRNHLGAQL